MNVHRELSIWSPPSAVERLGLWDYDVVEAFIGSDPDQTGRYTEFEWSPGETLDLVDLPEKISAGLRTPVSSHEVMSLWRIWTGGPHSTDNIMREALEPGTRWKLNLYRHDRADGTSAASPTLRGSFHVPVSAGWNSSATES